MTLRRILTHPDPRLATRSEPIETIDDEVRALLRDMAETMYAAPGVGLAAPQVGVNLRAVVIDAGPPEAGGAGLIQIVNPRIESADGEIIWEEGCLSVPGVSEQVCRFERVVAIGLGPDGEERRYEAGDLLAVVFQHEIDHLDGILFPDRLSPLKRRMLLKDYRKLREEEVETKADKGQRL